MKKFICLVLVVAMALSMGITSAFAEDEKDSVTLAVEDATGYAGELVSVKVDLTANSGVYGMLLPISCTGPISLESYSSGALTGWTVAKNAVWYNDKEANNDTTGTIITLNFRVDDDAAVGDTATVTVGTNAQALDKDLKDVTINAASATVTVGTQTDVTAEELTAVVSAGYITASMMCEDSVYMRYTLTSTSLPMDEGNICLLFWTEDEYPGAGNITYENASYSRTFEKVGNEYIVTGDGIPAKMMGDKVLVALGAKNSDGTTVCSSAINSSPMKYCKYAYNNSTSEKALCVSLMNYGAQAQLSFDYKTSSLMNSFITD